MRTLCIDVPDDRCLDEWWKRAPSDAVASAIEAIGSLQSSDVHADAVARIEALQAKLQGANEAAQAAACAASERIEQAWSRRADEKDKVIEVLQTQCDGLRAMAEQARDACETQQRISEALTRSIASGGGSTTTAQQMGGVAESEVEGIIAETLACDITDVSRATGHGDRFVTTPDGLRLMLEVKNVERLHSKHDMEKFRNDAYNGVKAERINAALLVSLKTTSIPNVSGACSVTFLQTDTVRAPVILLATRSRVTIQLAVHAIAQLQSIAAKEASARGGGSTPVHLEALERERCVLQKTLPEVLRFVQESETAIESRIEMLQRLLDDAAADRARQKNVNYQLLKLQQGVSWIATAQEGHDMDVAVEIALKWFERKGDFPKTSEMTSSQRVAIKNAGGLKAVVEAAKKRRIDDGGESG